MSQTQVVTRFAPSPTGLLHLGNARTALLNFLAARKSGGRFILRVEDSDETRSDDRLMHQLFTDLRWLGLDWDEGPDIGGPSHAYRQQHRSAIYEEWLTKLDASGLTYPCFCTPAELSRARKRQVAAGQPQHYAGTCRDLSDEQRAERLLRGLPGALRFRVPEGRSVLFDDVVHGEQRCAADDIGDFIIRRSDGGTAFFFANAIDDALMGVTLVLRGDDHLANTPRQILLLEALGLPVPRYGHIALLHGMDGTRLARRHEALSLQELRKRGFLAAAIRNHLVRLGHTPAVAGWLDDAAMRDDFDLKHLQRSPAHFDEVQLRHWQRLAAAHLTDVQFAEWIKPEMPPGLDAARVTAFCRVVRSNVEVPSDVRPWAAVVFGKLHELPSDAMIAVLEAGERFFGASIERLTRTDLDVAVAMRELAEATGRRGPELYLPLRAALTGVTHGPDLDPLLELIPRAEVRARLEHARELAG
jgi:glutamyl-tRNA synthetase